MSLSRSSILAFAPILIAAGAAFWLFTKPVDIVVDALDVGEVIEASATRRISSSISQGRTERIPVDAEVSMTVLVRDGSREPVRSAVVTLVVDGQPIVVGKTDEEGATSLQFADSKIQDDALLIGKATGFARSKVEISERWPETVELVLEAGTRIEGQVQLQDGSRPGVRSRVFAWPNNKGSRPPLDDLTPSRTPPPHVLWVETDDSGKFDLAGLRTGVSYDLVAGAPGWTSSSVARSIPSGSADVNLTLWRIYACALKVREIGGGLPPRCRANAGRTNPSKIPGSKHSRSASQLDRALSGLSQFRTSVDAMAPPDPWDWRDFVLAYKDGRVQDQLRSVTVGFQVPGFRAHAARVPLFALSTSLPSRTIFLDRVVSGFGAIDVHLISTLAPALHPVTAGPSPGMLELRSIDGGSDLKIGFDRVGELKQRVTDIPFGTYKASFTTCSASFRTDPKTGGGIVRVGPQPQAISFDVSALAAVRIRIVDAEGKMVENEGSLVIRGEKKGRQRVAFLRILLKPPYVVDGLVAGEWRLSVEYPYKGRRVDAKVLGMKVAPGALVEQSIVLEQD